MPAKKTPKLAWEWHQAEAIAEHLCADGNHIPGMFQFAVMHIAGNAAEGGFTHRAIRDLLVAIVAGPESEIAHNASMVLAALSEHLRTEEREADA